MTNQMEVAILPQITDLIPFGWTISKCWRNNINTPCAIQMKVLDICSFLACAFCSFHSSLTLALKSQVWKKEPQTPCLQHRSPDPQHCYPLVIVVGGVHPHLPKMAIGNLQGVLAACLPTLIFFRHLGS